MSPLLRDIAGSVEMGPTGPPYSSGGVSGVTTLAFGSSPGKNYATIDVTGMSGLTSASNIFAYFQSADVTATNGKDNHTLATMLIQLTCEYLTATSFRIHGLCEQGFVWGDFKVHYAIL